MSSWAQITIDNKNWKCLDCYFQTQSNNEMNKHCCCPELIEEVQRPVECVYGHKIKRRDTVTCRDCEWEGNVMDDHCCCSLDQKEYIYHKIECPPLIHFHSSLIHLKDFALHASHQALKRTLNN